MPDKKAAAPQKWLAPTIFTHMERGCSVRVKYAPAI
jgi:hypothetical protein